MWTVKNYNFRRQHPDSALTGQGMREKRGEREGRKRRQGRAGDSMSSERKS